MTGLDSASLRQRQAALPDRSTWLSANAGSGKTRVLTDRVARLLLEDVPPQKILCLTYTKAAATEMQNRLFQRLGSWTMMQDADLAKALQGLGHDRPLDAADLSKARTLFARAIETPGGLKIQTIHSFCATLLRRFPLEAGVSPQFSEMEDRAGALLRAEIVDGLAEGPDADRVADVARYVSADDLSDLTAAIVSNRPAFRAAHDRAGILALLGVDITLEETGFLEAAFSENDAAFVALLPPLLRQGSTNDQKLADRLETVTAPSLGALVALEQVFLTGAKTKSPFSAKIGSVPTKALQTGVMAPHMAQLDDLMARIEESRSTRLALMAADKTDALHRFAQLFLPIYAERKQARGWLDFDDLILKARDLLNDPAVAQWVLFRLDGGIDHILVDEAQDTSPTQWDVIERLAQEFSAGEGARSDVARTIFVVGDVKQSIYSFQGADPDEFARMRDDFGARLEATGQGLQKLELEHSFRSADAILRLVDLVFEAPQQAGFMSGSHHIAFKSALPGRVDLWPAVPKMEDVEQGHWTDPVDSLGSQHHNVILAQRIASQIKGMLDSGQIIPDDEDAQGVVRYRTLRAGDFLILVQRRSELFSEIIRACKAANLPIAGADRLKVGAELAVRDLGVLLAFLSVPEDSLALATALKSPLFGWSEQDLFDLAHRRNTAFLWEALRDRRDDFPETLAILDDLRGQTDFLRPYDLIERILTRHEGRKKLLARLGPEAEDGINALLSQALGYERTSVPSLTGFLVWMETDDLEIKRQISGAGDMVRVMTVHGAKGLEAPVVILPDTGTRRDPSGGDLMLLDGVPFWKPASGEMPDALQDVRQAWLDRQRAERQRLLYVALTRAEKWLILAAAGDPGDKGESWYEAVETALKQADAVSCDMPGGPGLRLETGNWQATAVQDPPAPVAPVPPLPDALRDRPTAYVAPPETVSPSDLGGAKALPGEAGLHEDEARQRGTWLHLLLEVLPNWPQDRWPGLTAQLLADAPADQGAQLLAEAQVVLDEPALGWLFAPDSLSEVPVTADVGGRRLHGSIDRLIVTDRKVTAVDFKSNRIVPESAATCPDGILRQMGAYALALQAIYPDRQVETAILWTRTAQLMLLPHDTVTAAVARAPLLDAGPTRS